MSGAASRHASVTRRPKPRRGAGGPPRNRLDALLDLIASGDAVIERHAESDDRIVVRVAAADGLVRRRIARSDLATLASDGAVTIDNAALMVTAAGTARLRRGAAPPEHAFLAQHGGLDKGEVIDTVGRSAAVLLDAAESPLAWLGRSRAGKPAFLAAVEVAAGERLRSDFTLGQMGPRLSPGWTTTRTGSRPSGDAGLGAYLTDAALDARRRHRAALEDAGPEFAGLLVDVCCFLKGLAEVEAERVWPARSAKLVLKLGLARLARHYGLSTGATGRARAGLRHWGTDDFRPEW